MNIHTVGAFLGGAPMACRLKLVDDMFALLHTGRLGPHTEVVARPVTERCKDIENGDRGYIVSCSPNANVFENQHVKSTIEEVLSRDEFAG